MSDYEFSMPWPPTVNHYHQPVRMGRGVRIIKSKVAKEYAKDCEKWFADLGLENEMIPEDKKLSMRLVLSPPTLARYDVDNRTKGVMDALSNCNFYVDDSQIYRLVVEKGEKVKGGRVDVFISII